MWSWLHRSDRTHGLPHSPCVLDPVPAPPAPACASRDACSSWIRMLAAHGAHSSWSRAVAVCSTGPGLGATCLVSQSTQSGCYMRSSPRPAGAGASVPVTISWSWVSAKEIHSSPSKRCPPPGQPARRRLPVYGCVRDFWRVIADSHCI